MAETGQELTLRADTALAEPSDVVAQATKQADALMEIVHRRGLFTQIGSKEFLQAEAWQVVSAFNEVAWVTEWVRPIEIKGEIVAYEAKVNLVKRGVVVGAAIMSCGLDDDVCKSREGWDQHKTAMSAAETWAGAKASRMKFAWVAVLAGFAPTPAEEMIRQKEGEQEERKRAANTEAPMGLCPVHKAPFVHRQGVSKKTGKPYDFWPCPERDCNQKAEERPRVIEGQIVEATQPLVFTEPPEGHMVIEESDLDDQGQVPAIRPTPTTGGASVETFNRLKAIMEKYGVKAEAVKRRYKVSSLADLSESYVVNCIGWIEDFAQQKGQG